MKSNKTVYVRAKQLCEAETDFENVENLCESNIVFVRNQFCLTTE